MPICPPRNAGFQNPGRPPNQPGMEILSEQFVLRGNEHLRPPRVTLAAPIECLSRMALISVGAIARATGQDLRMVFLFAAGLAAAGCLVLLGSGGRLNEAAAGAEP